MSGDIREETPYVDGKREGVKKIYFRSGELMMEITYGNDKQEGAVREYSEDGSLVKESFSKGAKVEE